MKIYLASSWRNAAQPHVLEQLRGEGHVVYDFRNPAEGDAGFHWSEIDPEWQAWEPDQFITALGNPIADHGFANDMDALRACEVCVLLLPCGRSAHLEAGWAAGAKRKLLILVLQKEEPELMYRMADAVCSTFAEMFATLCKWEAEKAAITSDPRSSDYRALKKILREGGQ